jgi:hypothetical protein
MPHNFSEFVFLVYAAICEDFFVILFWAMIAFIFCVILFVATELRNYDLKRTVTACTKQARERHNRLKDRIASARAAGFPAFDYNWGDRLLNGVTLCLDDADRKVERAPSHIKSYKTAWKDVKLAGSQLDDVEELFSYVPSEG